MKIQVNGKTLSVEANTFCDMFHYAKMYLHEMYEKCITETERDDNLKQSMNAEDWYNFFVMVKNDKNV